MSTIITTIAATDRASESREDINQNFADRHSLDVTAVAFADTPYTVLDTDQLIVVNGAGGAITVQLPTAASFVNRSLYVVAKSVAGGNVTIDGDASETINGATTKVLSAAYSGCRITSDGSEWFAH